MPIAVTAGVYDNVFNSIEVLVGNIFRWIVRGVVEGIQLKELHSEPSRGRERFQLAVWAESVLESWTDSRGRVVDFINKGIERDNCLCERSYRRLIRSTIDVRWFYNGFTIGSQ